MNKYKVTDLETNEELFYSKLEWNALFSLPFIAGIGVGGIISFSIWYLVS